VSLGFFVSDLHGRTDRYRKLWTRVARERPAGVFLGGDLLPFGSLPGGGADSDAEDFADGFLAEGFRRLRGLLKDAYPRVFLILGNDDPRASEAAVEAASREGLWEYVHGRRATWDAFNVYGYACVPPTPFRMKDWERYDVSRYVDPHCCSPEEGWRSLPEPPDEIRYGTIEKDLARLTGGEDLDRAALDGRQVDHVPLDVHVGSIAIRRLIDSRQPLLGLHGHVHESARLTGAWWDRLGRTLCLSAAHDGPELALVRFDPVDPGVATRELV
jgi:uncharacterized protein